MLAVCAIGGLLLSVILIVIGAIYVGVVLSGLSATVCP